MAPAEWDHIFDVFHAAREKSGGERVMLLNRECGEDTPLRKAVEELLREDEAADGFLSEPFFGISQRGGRPAPVAPGQHFGRYITVALVGRGGMGDVWSAHDTDLDRLVALKFLSSEAIAVLDADQIKREAKAASGLNHPGIVTIYEVVQSGSSLAIAMELVEGTSLRALCGKPVPISEVLVIGAQISDALAAAHGCGTIHGDIKPENILLRRDRYVKVLDFGLARKVTTETTVSGMVAGIGTLRYMSPEQARGETLTPASDVFSCGLVLFELITGHHAYPNVSPVETARAILRQEAPALPPGNGPVPAQLAGLIRAMLAKDPLKRPSAEEVARKLHELQVKKASTVAHWKWTAVAMVAFGLCFAAWRWKQTRQTPTFRQITTLVPENRATAAAISPDGKLAAYANIDGIFVRTIQSGETRALSSPNDYILDRLAWFADGSKLAASGFASLTHVPSVWIIPADGKTPRLLRTNAGQASPSPDGTRLVFTSRDESEIWVMRANGEEPRRITGSPQDRFEVVFWSPDGRRIGFLRHHYSVSSDSRSYQSIVLATGKVSATAPNSWMRSAAALPDGRILFLRFDNDDFVISRELCELKTDLATGAPLGPARRIATLPGEDTTLLDVTATPDGKQALVLRQSDQLPVFVGDFVEHPPRILNARRLTLDERSNFPHAWTADSRAVIFESNRNGNFDLFKQYIDRRTPEVIIATPYTEILAQLSPDGRFVLYAAKPHEDPKDWYYKPNTYKLMRIPVDGGSPQEVPIGGPLDEFRCALGANGRCVLRTTQAGQYRTYYDLDPIRGKGRELARIKWSPEILGDWDISPDGKQVAIPTSDSPEAKIRVILLEPKPNEPAEHDLVLHGVSDLHGLVAAADDSGWFASIDTTVGNRMLYVYPDGRFDSLGDIQGWAVPSPDGHHVAFLNRIIATNVWLMERH